MPVRAAQDDRLQQGFADCQLQQWRRLRRTTAATTATTGQRSFGG